MYPRVILLIGHSAVADEESGPAKDVAILLATRSTMNQFPVHRSSVAITR